MAEATQRWPTITGAIQPLLRVQGELLFETRPTYVDRQYADAVHSVISPRNFREEMHKVNDVFQKRGPRQDMRYVSSWAPIGCGIALAIAGLLGTLNDALLYVGIALTCAGVLLTLHFVRDKKHRLQRGLDDVKAHLEKELNPRMAAAGLTYSLGSFTYTASGINAAGEHYKVEQTNHYITVIPSAALLEAHRLRPSASSSSAAAQRSAAAGHANADAALARAVAAATGQGQQLSHEQQQQQLGGPGSAAGSMVSLDSYWRLQVDCESVPDPTGVDGLGGPGSASSSAPATSRAWMSSQLDLASMSMTVDGGGNGNGNGGGLGFIVPSSTRSQGSARRSSNPPLPASFEFQLSHHTHGAGGQQQLVLPGGSAAAAAGTSAGAGAASGTAVQALPMRQPIFFTMLATPTLTGMPGPGHGPSASASTVPAAAGFRFLNPLHAHTPPTGTANGAGSGGSVPAIATAGGGTAGNTNTPTQLVTPPTTAGAPISLAALLLARGAASGLGGAGGGAVPPPLILNSSSSSSPATLPAGTVAAVSSPLILPPSSTSTLNLLSHTPAAPTSTTPMSPLQPPTMPPLLLGLPAAAATSAASSASNCNSDDVVSTPNINGIEFQSSMQPAMSASPFSLQLQPFRARDSPLARQLHAQLAERPVPSSASGTPTLTPRNRAPAHSPALAAITGISSLSPVVLAWSAPPDHDVAAAVSASDGDPT